MKTVVITGANSGLGFETAGKIAMDKDYKVVLACRNLEKASIAREEIVSRTGNPNILTMRIDTSSLASVAEFAREFISREGSLYALVNNAGISPMGNSGMTEDGFELVFATNYLGHFLLTNLLLPFFEPGGRILSVSSDMHNPPGGISWRGVEALAHPSEDSRLKYSYSKLCMIYFTHYLNDLLVREGRNLRVNSFNPGFMADTNFSKGGGKMREMAIKTAMPERYGTLETSSDALSLLVTGESFGAVGGEYFDRSTSTAASSELSYDRNNATELWERSLEYVAAFLG